MLQLTNAHALIVGLANYRFSNRLPATVLADAQAIHDALIAESLCAYPPGNVRPLPDGAATQAGLRQVLVKRRSARPYACRAAACRPLPGLLLGPHDDGPATIERFVPPPDAYRAVDFGR